MGVDGIKLSFTLFNSYYSAINEKKNFSRIVD